MTTHIIQGEHGRGRPGHIARVFFGGPMVASRGIAS